MKNKTSLMNQGAPRRAGQAQVVSAREYLVLSQQTGRIERVRVVAPRLGDAHPFGQIEVTLK